MQALFANVRTWITANRRNTVITAVTGGVLALCLTCSWIGLATTGKKPLSTTQPTHTPGSTTKPTLGSPVAAFTAKFGTPDTSTLTDYRYNRTCGDGSNWCITASVFPGKDGKNYVEFIDLVAPPGGWDTPTAQASCGTFLPADAKLKQSVNVPNTGVDRVYSSATLAQIFTADQFLDAQQNLVTPGLFDVLYTTTEGQVNDCTLELGTAQETA